MSLPTEDETYQELIQALDTASDRATRIAFLREDNRWITIARGLEAQRQLIRSLMASRVSASLGFRGDGGAK